METKKDDDELLRLSECIEALNASYLPKRSHKGISNVAYIDENNGVTNKNRSKLVAKGYTQAEENKTLNKECDSRGLLEQEASAERRKLIFDSREEDK